MFQHFHYFHHFHLLQLIDSPIKDFLYRLDCLYDDDYYDDYYKHYKLDTEEKQDRDNKKLVEKMVKTKNDVKLHVYNKSRTKKK